MTTSLAAAVVMPVLALFGVVTRKRHFNRIEHERRLTHLEEEYRHDLWRRAIFFSIVVAIVVLWWYLSQYWQQVEEAKKKNTGVIKYSGFTEHAYRLVFDFQDKYSNSPHLLTILPDGTIENEKDLEPKKDKGLIAYSYCQNTTQAVAAKHPKSAFIWERGDGSYALVQTWPTNYNEKFRAEYVCTTTNPNPNKFDPTAAEEFKKTVVELFGQHAESHNILYCHRKTTNPKTVYRGTAAELQAFLRANPDVVKEMDIIELIENGIVCRTVNGKKEEGKTEFQFSGDRNTKYALYTKQGWDTMACITQWQQFEKDRDMNGVVPPKAGSYTTSNKEA